MYPEAYEGLSDYQSRRMTRVFGAAWSNGWIPNYENFGELADYLLEKRSRDDISQTFGPHYSVHPSGSSVVAEVDDDTRMAEWLSKEIDEHDF